MISLNEDRLIRIGKNADLRGRLQRHNARHLSRVYPRGTRFFANMSATDMSHAIEMGCQMVALNFQTWDAAMQLNYALFRQNRLRLRAARAAAAPAAAGASGARLADAASLAVGRGAALDRGFGVGGGGDEGSDASEERPRDARGGGALRHRAQRAAPAQEGRRAARARPVGRRDARTAVEGRRGVQV